MARKALCIGINNYPGTHMDLQGCVNDAQDWAAVLQARGYTVTTLLDKHATKTAMVQAMSDLIGAAGNGAFTYYALKTLKALKPDASYADWNKAIGAYLPSASYPQSPQIVGNKTARKQKVFA